MKIDNTVFIVETEESETARETAEQKIKKLIEAGIDGLIEEERRRLNNQKATFEVVKYIICSKIYLMGLKAVTWDMLLLPKRMAKFRS